MSQFKQNLAKARGSLTFVVGMTLAFGTVASLERWQPREASSMVSSEYTGSPIELSEKASLPLRAQRPLTSNELEMAKVAWSYFENNTDAETGLVNSVDGYTAATLWDSSSYLLGLLSARDLEIIDHSEFESRLTRVLSTLAEIPLFDGQLPNKVYSTVTGTMTTYENQPTARGVGWSAIDIGRIMVPFNALVWRYPEFTASIETVLSNWDMQAIIRDAEMFGAAIDEQDETIYLQEGRLGYEEYAAKSLVLAGLDLSEAVNYERYFEYVEIDGIKVGTDLRSPDKLDALNFVVSEPYVLDGIEFGWDRFSKSLAYGVYRAQEERFKRTGALTAVSEDNIDQAPYFVYNSVFADGKAWNAVTESGEDATPYRTLSTKAALGWYALYDTPYTQKLFERVQGNFSEGKGFYAGIYEESGEINEALTANTNGIVLESLRYIEHGPMVSIGRRSVATAESTSI